SHGRQEQKQTDNQSRSNNKSGPARAPYNFIPLNTEIVSAETPPSQDRFHENMLSGQIDLTITNKTPFFIRGRKWDKEKKEWVESENFFEWKKNKPAIPGSSLRGMVRSLVEISTFSELDMFDDKQLYRRFNMITDKNDQINYGFLRKVGQEYILKEVATKPKQVQKSEDLLSKNPYHYKYNGNDCFYSVGEFQYSSRVWKFIWNNTGNKDVVDEKVLDGYRYDKNRAEEAIDILESLSRGYIVNGVKEGEQIGSTRVKVPSEKGIPIFFRRKNGKIISFGNAKYHRIPYNYTISDFIRQTKPVNFQNDFAKTIFGTTENTSRIAFEDCVINIGQKNFHEFENSVTPKILSSPKPTTYQHYLKQDSVNVSELNLKTWNSKNSLISGYKGYWHRETPSNKTYEQSWVENGEVKKSHAQPIKPLTSGTIFSGRIRFENLSQVELGCLLFVLHLPEGCYHKMGFGKPLGLGSVEIKPTLTLIDRKQRYVNLFNIDKNGWNNGLKDKHLGDNLNKYKNAFAEFMNGKADIECDDWEALWKNKRLEQLKIMLTSDHSKVDDWLDKTRYQELSEFKKRPVLPSADEVIKNNTYN
ncbi:MAG: TIGR03986 family CRISPR-associated RAMP protein, partial [Saprospiraceae bacterium]